MNLLVETFESVGEHLVIIKIEKRTEMTHRNETRETVLTQQQQQQQQKGSKGYFVGFITGLLSFNVGAVDLLISL